MWSHGDFDGNGTVDFLDFNIWAANRFQSSRPAVPEPRIAWLLFVGLLGVARGRAGPI